MSEELIKELLEAGVHFGHQTRRWNPKMARYIFAEKSGIYIIDLEKTVQALKDALTFLTGIAAKGETVLFVGTKKQAQEIIISEAGRCGTFSISHRWIGGLLTNFSTVKKRIQRLNELEKMKAEGTMETLAKKERIHLNRELEKLLKTLSGIRQMEELPKVLYIVDPRREETAVKEANILKIPIVALIDTNSDPDTIDYPIPGNDDAIKSIRLITNKVAEAILQGRERFKNYLAEDSVKKKLEQLMADTGTETPATPMAAEVQEPSPEAQDIDLPKEAE